jgi:hypothetical protein
MPTSTTAPLPAPEPATLVELEAVLYAELARHLATTPPGGYVRGYPLGRYAGYVDGLAAAIHHITGEPVADITAIARDEARRVS